MKLVRVPFLSNKNLIKSFDCGDEDLNEFIREDAKIYEKELVTKTYWVVDKENKNVCVGYISLVFDSLKVEKSHPSSFYTCQKLKGIIHSEYPALKIARLAINKNLQNKGYGKEIISHLIAIFHTFNGGCRFLTVDSKMSAIVFYKKCGFRFFINNEKTNISNYFLI